MKYLMEKNKNYYYYYEVCCNIVLLVFEADSRDGESMTTVSECVF